MGTYAELKARVASEIVRTDQAANIVSAIARAIEFYAGQRFWFNQRHATAILTPGETYLASPRVIDDIYVLWTGQPERLDEITQEEIEELHATNTASQRPYLFARYGDRLRVYPTPDQSYTFRSYGVFDLTPALSADGDANAWTTEAQDLIAARAKLYIVRDIIGSVEKTSAAQLAERDALKALRRETTIRVGTGRLQPSC